VLYLDEDPTELTKAYYPLELAEGSAIMQPSRRGSPAVVNELGVLGELGYPPHEFVDDVSSEIPTEEEVVALELPKDMPVLLTFRVVYSDNRRPIEASLLTKAAHRFRMRYHVSLP
jgi:GntR family transcriptional regulator